MSAKFVAYMRSVPNPMELLSKNLRLPVNKNQWIEVEKYNVDIETAAYCPSVKDAFYTTEPYPYWHFFSFDGHGDSWIRTEFFDFVRALGLKEMWFMDENLEPQGDGYESIEALVQDLGAELHEYKWEELTKELDESGFTKAEYYSLYHDDFHDLFARVERIEQEHCVHVLGLKRFDEDYIRVERDGNIELLKI